MQIQVNLILNDIFLYGSKFFFKQYVSDILLFYNRRNGHHLWQVLRYIRRIFQKIEIINALNIDAAHL